MLDLTLMTILCWTSSGGRDCLKRRVEQTTHEPFRVCYYTTWARYRPGHAAMHPHHVDPHLCSHIIIAFATISPEGSLAMHSESDDSPIVEAVVALKQLNPKLKVLIAIGGWNFGSEPFRRIISSEKNRVAFVNSSLSFMKQWKLDGLDIDWEYPDVQDRENFTQIIKELAEAFSDESAVANRSKYLLTAAVPGIKQKMNGYDVPVVNKYFDFISVMNYDFHGPWDNKTGHNSPLYSHDGYNLAEGTQLWLDAGFPRSKIIVGLPTYGHAFKLQDTTNPVVGTPTVGGIAGTYTRTPGFFAFYEVCELLHQEDTIVLWDHFAAVPYCYNQNTWVSFDDVRSLEKKVEWTLRQHYGGVMIWELGMDDFSGTFCAGAEKNITYPLLKSINAAMSITKLPSLTPRAKEASTVHPEVPSDKLNSTETIDLTKEDLSCNFTKSIPINCTHFVGCIDGVAQEMVCPFDLVFDEDKSECVHQAEVPECIQEGKNLHHANTTELLETTNITSIFTEKPVDVTVAPHGHSIESSKSSSNISEEKETKSTERSSSEENEKGTLPSSIPYTSSPHMIELNGHWKNWKRD